MQLFSINAASLALERDRRTLVRAMAGVEPDGHQNKQPRWKLSSIVFALTGHEARIAAQNCPSLGAITYRHLVSVKSSYGPGSRRIRLSPQARGTKLLRAGC